MPQAAPQQAAAGASSGLATVLRDLLARRNFQQVLQIAETQQQAIEKDPQLGQLVSAAKEQLEAETYIQGFLTSARKLRAEGRHEEAAGFLEKARMLAPDIPELAILDAEPASAEEPVFEPDLPQMPDFDAIAGSPVDTPAGRKRTTPSSRSFRRSPRPMNTAPWTFPPPPTSERRWRGPPTSRSTPSTEPIDLSPAADAPPAQEPTPTQEPTFHENTAQEPAGSSLPPLPTDAAAPETPAEPSSDGGRIAQLLREGQEIFDRGDYQAAIDVWSRIFLIDIDNEEANRLIDEARGKKAELERQAEQFFHEGIGHLESQSLEEATAAFERVVELHPSHSLANEYLDQLRAGKVPTPIAVSSLETSGDELDALGEELPSIDDLGPSDGERGASLEAAVERDRIVAVKKTDRKLIAIGALGLVLLAGGAYFLATK